MNIIAAASLNSVIGYNNNIPWLHDYPEDLAFFKKMTLNSTVIMGKNTFNSIGKSLPKRRNIVLSKKIVPRINNEVEQFISLENALETCSDDVWVIGGSFVYQAALKYANKLYITTIPKVIEGDNLIYFPYVNPDFYQLSDKIEINKEKNLYCNVFERY